MFGLHLRRGNSLIGARRAVYRRNQIENKTWLTGVPTDVDLARLTGDGATAMISAGVGGIHHFLLPATGWGSSAEAKEAAALVPDAVKAVKQWRGSIRSKPSKKQLTVLDELSHRVETLWAFALQRLRIADREIRRAIPIWNAPHDATSEGTIQREHIEAALADVDGAYQRLRRVMDAWCALWFWPLTEAGTRVEVGGVASNVTPPTLDQWISGLRAILGADPGSTGSKGASGRGPTLAAARSWAELAEAEEVELGLAGAQPIGRVLRDHPWLQVCEQVSRRQGFFHWELDFAPAFARGGFDLQVGNPPWVRPDVDMAALLAEGDPWWQLELKPSQTLIAAKRAETLADRRIFELVATGVGDMVASREFMGSSTEFPDLAGLRPDTYRCFIVRAWSRASENGIVGLVHPETHFTDEKAGPLRADAYGRLRRHWQFINELVLFDVHHLVIYGVHVYGQWRSQPKFLMATSLYHPDTVERSLRHDGSGDEPGIKDAEGFWDQRPHLGRIIHVDSEVLETWHAILEQASVPTNQTRMVYTVNRSTTGVLDKLARARRIGELGLYFSQGWNETTDRAKGRFEVEWGAPSSWNDVILQGPHLHVSSPMYKSPNKTMRHNLDWSTTDLEALEADAIPVTAYKPTGDRGAYDSTYTHWETAEGRRSAREFYRVAWRAMAANTGERTLIPALISRGATHINGVFAVGIPVDDRSKIVDVAGFSGSLVADFVVRAAPKSGIYQNVFYRLPFVRNFDLHDSLRLRVLRLNCLTDAYADLWAENYDSEFGAERWSKRPLGSPIEIGEQINPIWNSGLPLRLAAPRRQAQLEVDALVALALGLTADELCTIYRTQFAVLYGYDRNVYFFDAKGRLVPNSVLTLWRKKGDSVTETERTATNQAGNTYTYELPFVTLDREADMRQAYAHFERQLAERS